MPRTSRKPFRNHLFVVEVNNRVKVDGEFIDAWEYESTITGQLIPGSTVMRGVQYEKANDSVQHKIMFRDDPHLTVNHRLIYLGRTMHFRGVTQPMEAGLLWEVFVEESTAEQASQFMRMEGMGITGVANMVHVMSGGMLVGGEDYFDDEFSTSSSSSLSTSSSSSSSTKTASSSSSGSSASTESSSHSSSTSSSSSTSGSSSSLSSSSSSTATSGSSSSSSSGTVTSSSSSSVSSSSSSASTTSGSSSSLV